MNQQTQNQKLYVGNLNFDANEEEVRTLFGTFGGVEDVKIVMDRFSGKSRGFAFVRMDSQETAGKAKDALNGQPFQGKALVIDWARMEQRDRPTGERRERFNEFRPRREGGWGGDRGDRQGFRSDRSGGFYNR